VSHNSARANFGNIIPAATGPGSDRRLPRRRSGPADDHRQVYNASEMPPYPLPDKKNKSGVAQRDNRHDGPYDGAENPPSGQAFNEISMDDTGGQEQLFVRAQALTPSPWSTSTTPTPFQRDQTGRRRAQPHHQHQTTRPSQSNRRRKPYRDRRASGDVDPAERAADGQSGRHVDHGQPGQQDDHGQHGQRNQTVSMGSYSLTAMQQISLTVGSNSIVISHRDHDQRDDDQPHRRHHAQRPGRTP